MARARAMAAALGIFGSQAACAEYRTHPPRTGVPERAEVAEAEVGAVAEAMPEDADLTEEELRRARLRSGLLQAEWRWVRFVDPVAGGIDVPSSEQYTLSFREDGTVEVQADCNAAQGAFLLDGNEVTIRLTEVTDEECPAGSLSDEFIDNVGSVAQFYLVRGWLLLALRWDTGFMHLAPEN